MTQKKQSKRANPRSVCAAVFIVLALNRILAGAAVPVPISMASQEFQLTHSRSGHILTHTGVWSPDSRWIVYDTRSDPAGSNFDGSQIEMVNVETRQVQVLYRAKRGAHCGVATFHPLQEKVIFILGPENPDPEWQYCAWHRQGVIVDVSKPGQDLNLDACDLTAPFTPGALRGGSHVHVWDPAGQWVSFTYEDHVLAQFQAQGPDHDANLRNVGVSVPGQAVTVKKDHPRNHDGRYFSVLATRTTASPRSGSDEIQRACEEGWVGSNGYVRPDGSRQLHALAFQGTVRSAQGDMVAEVFIVDLPNDVTQPGDGPLAGTQTRCPFPPRGTVQRRLTFTTGRKFPGIQGPRHWLHSSPNGERIAFLMKDDSGLTQLWTVSPNGGAAAQLTRNPWPIASAFSWSPDGRSIAHVLDNSVCLTDLETGNSRRLTNRSPDALAPRPEACVISPDGKKIAFVRTVAERGGMGFNQVFIVNVH